MHSRIVCLATMLALFAAVLVLISDPAALAETKPPTTAPSMEQLQKDLEKNLKRHLPELRFNNNKAVDCIDFLRDVTGANIYVDWRALDIAGIKTDAPVKYTARDVPFQQALDDILKGLGGTDAIHYEVVGNVILISTDDGIKTIKDAIEAVPLKVDDAKLQSQLDKPLPELRFSGNSFSDVVSFTRDVTGMNIFVNWKGLKAAGIEQNAPVTMKLRNIPSREGLILILHEVSTPTATPSLSIDRGTLNIAIKTAL